MSLEKWETNSSDSLICREDEQDPDDHFPQRNPEPTSWRGHAAPKAGWCSVGQPKWKLHLADKTLISGRDQLHYQHYLGAAVGEGEQRYSRLHSPAKSIGYEEGWRIFSGLDEAFRFETCVPLHTQTHTATHNQVTKQPFETFRVHQVQSSQGWISSDSAIASLVLWLPAIWLLLFIIRFSTFSLFTWSKLVPIYTAVQCMSNQKGFGLFICFTIVSQTPWQHQGSHFYTITYKSYTPFPKKMLPIALFFSYTNKITVCRKIFW